MTEKYYREGAWWASPYNEKPEVQAQSLPQHPVEIHDATLRDGEQTPGVVFSRDDKVHIAEKLIECGVTRIEAGMPAVSKQDYDAICEIAKRFPQAKIFSFARATHGDIDMAADCGATGVVIETPIGYPKLKHQFNWTWEKVLEKSADSIRYAKSKGLYAVYFPYDATRAHEDDIENLFHGLMENDARPDSVGVVDTMGCALPQTIQYMVRWYKRLLNDIPVEVHTHNDFGMAVASELAGVAAGAEVVHSCINGLGERTGNAALEELILSLNILLGQDTPYRMEPLLELCQMVEKISGVHCAPNKPFVGERNYMRESGIGVDLVMKEPLAMFATDPRFFHRTAHVALGKKSGKASIQYYLEQMNLTATDEQVAEMLSMVKEKGIEKKGLLTKEEFEAIVQQVL